MSNFLTLTSNKQLLSNFYIILNIPNIYDQSPESITVNSKLLAII